MSQAAPFGQWLKQRRKALDMTQQALADCVGCSLATIEKIEGGGRRPSRQVGVLLAECLRIEPVEREAFVSFARGGSEASPGEEQVAPSPASLPRAPGILPAQPNAFIGREREVDEARDLLLRQEVRLLSMTGPPGIGKTRLALQVAAGLKAELADGVFFVALAPVSDPALVAPAIALSLGLREASGEPLDEVLRGYLRERQILLVLDNFEQVVAAKPLLMDLLAGAPRLKLLVTSRTLLRVYGEHEFPVPVMSLPGSPALSSPERLGEFEAVRLFVERARAARPTFALTEQNGPIVAEICARLDGLPLAIELAASRIKVLTPQAMLGRMGSRLKLLSGGPRTLSSRGQTLHDAIAWSYDLLEAAEKSLFRRLAVFVGGWSLEAAEQVCRIGSADGGVRNEPYAETVSTIPHSIIDALESLADHSLVRREDGSDESRFRMLETIREYALERLLESGEAVEVRGRYVAFYRDMVEEAEPQIQGAEQGTWLDRLEVEHGNIRAALELSLGSGDVETAARISSALRRFWYLHGHMSEGRRWLEQVLAAGELPPGLHARVLHGLGTLTWSQGEYEAARTHFRASLEISRELDDKHGVANMLHNLAVAALPLGEYDEAQALHEESMQLFRELGDRWSIALSLANLGLVALNRGEYERAHDLLEESLALRRDLGEKQSVAQSLNNLGIVVRCRGDYARAYSLHAEGLAIFTELGDGWSIALSHAHLGLAALGQGDNSTASGHFIRGVRIGDELGARQVIAPCLEGLAGVSARTGKGDAALLFGAAEAIRESTGAPIAPADRPDYERNLAAARDSASPETFERAWGEGRRLTLQQVVAYVMGRQ